jgi:hypothetical protein
MVEDAEPLALDSQSIDNAVNGMTSEANKLSTGLQNYSKHQLVIGQQLQVITGQQQTLQNLIDSVNELRKELQEKFTLLGAKYVALVYLYD